MAGKIRNLNDLAKQVGCTATAVSMALHDSPQLSEELREKIKKTAKENDFVPRSYNRRTVRVKKRYSHLGPLLLLHNDFFNELNPARDQTMPYAFQLLNQYGVEYAYLDISEVRKNPELFREFAGVLYYNDRRSNFPRRCLQCRYSAGHLPDRVRTGSRWMMCGLRNLAFSSF